MGKKWEWLWTGLRFAVRKNPVEVLLAMFFCVLGCYLFEAEERSWDVVLRYSSILFLLTYVLNGLTRGRRWRALYYLSALFFLPLYVWVEKTSYTTFLVSFGVVQLVYLSSRWEKENRAFMRTALRYVGACLSAGLLAFIAWGLTVSVYYSIHYIFEIGEGWENRFVTYAASFSFLGLMPLLFLMFNREEGDVEGGRVFDVLVNFVLSPALLVYAVILYLYFVKITLLWSLPKGAVAYIVISFTSATFLLRGCQAFVSKRYYDWFYPWSSWAVLPALAMYWVGASYRIHQYGFTEARVYLVVVGLILTGMAFLFFSRRTGRYLYVALWAIGLLSAVTYIPGMTAVDIERISQTRRGNYPFGDDRAVAREKLSIESRQPVYIEGFRTLQDVQTYRTDEAMYLLCDEDSLFLHTPQGKLLFAASKDSLFNRQLRKVGLTPYDSIPEAVYPDLLKVELDSGVLLLEYIHCVRDSMYHVNWITPQLYLTY